MKNYNHNTKKIFQLLKKYSINGITVVNTKELMDCIDTAIKLEVASNK